MLLYISIFYGLLYHSCGQEIDPALSKLTDTIKMSIRMASRFLHSSGGSSILSNIRSSSRAQERGSKEKDFLLVLLKLMGVDNSKIKELAFSGLISVAQLISLVLTKNEKTKGSETSAKNFSPFRLIMSLPQVAQMLTRIQEPNLADLILNEGRDNLREYPAEDVDCIRLLICKTSPFVRGMQRSLRFFMRRDNVQQGTATGGCGRKELWKRLEEAKCERDDEKMEEARWERSNLEDRMYFFVPSLKEVVEFGDKCDERFPHCVY